MTTGTGEREHGPSRIFEASDWPYRKFCDEAASGSLVQAG